MSSTAYRAALDWTELTIQRRAVYFRNQVIVVVGLAAVVIAAAIVVRSVRALGALLWLVPVCGAFLVADGRLVRGWRARILADWSERRVDLVAFRQAVRAHPRLPPQTLEGMLATLPAPADLNAEQQLATSTRLAVAAATTADYTARDDSLVLNVLASGLATIVLVLVMVTGRWPSLALLAVLLLLPTGRHWTRRRRLRRAAAEIAGWRRAPDFAEADYVRLASGRLEA